MIRRVFLPLLGIVSLFAIVLFSACNKTGVNQGLDPNNQKPYDFMSTKSGSYWHYGSREGISYTRFARNKDSLKKGLIYSYYERQEDTGAGRFTPEYFGKNGKYYITLIDLDDTWTNYLEYVFWIEDAKQGDTWQNTGSIYYAATGDVKLYTSSNETEENLTMESGGTTYTGVIHVHSDLRTVTFNTRIGTLDMWFVKDIGVIRQEAHINIFGAYVLEHTDSLTNYHIEK